MTPSDFTRHRVERIRAASRSRRWAATHMSLRVIPITWSCSPDTYQAFAALKETGFTRIINAPRRQFLKRKPFFVWWGYIWLMTGRKKTGSARKNPVLFGLLAELGWSRSRLAAEVNAFMGRDYIGRTTVFEWVGNGRIPREPLPTVVAHLLSDAVGRKITVADLWGAGARKSASWMPADHGQRKMTFDYSGVLHTAGDWIDNVGRTMDSDRRKFMAVSGAALTTPAWAYLDAPARGDTIKATLDTPDAIKITPA